MISSWYDCWLTAGHVIACSIQQSLLVEQHITIEVCPNKAAACDTNIKRIEGARLNSMFVYNYRALTIEVDERTKFATWPALA